MREVPMPYGARMVTGTISHEEAEIRHFMEDPELAQIMLEDARAEGDSLEVQKIQRRIDEATRRAANVNYWGSIVDRAEQTAESGYNL